MAGELLASTQVVVLGLGLMGGSLALGLRRRAAAVLGLDPDPEARRLALARGAVERAEARLAPLLAGEAPETLLILAAPLGAILDWLERLPQELPGGARVLDLGSVKLPVLRAMQALPEGFDPLGGHPMCGREVGGMANAEAGLFGGATFALTPLERTSARLRALAGELVQALGAQPLWLRAETHDAWVAATSHTPYLLANTLAAATPAEARPLVGPGFRSASRLAPTPLSMMGDVLRLNRDQILPQLRRVQARLAALESALEARDWPAVQALLEAGAEQYRALVSENGAAGADAVQPYIAP